MNNEPIHPLEDQYICQKCERWHSFNGTKIVETLYCHICECYTKHTHAPGDEKANSYAERSIL